MNPKILASFCGEGQSVSEPNPAAFALWLRDYVGAVSNGQDATSVFVQIGDNQTPTKISESKGVSHFTGEHITLSVPDEHFAHVLDHLKYLGCGSLTVGTENFASVWKEGAPIGFLRIKKATPA